MDPLCLVTSEHRDVRHRSTQCHEGENRRRDNRAQPDPPGGVVERAVEQRQHDHHGQQRLQHVDVEPVRRPVHGSGAEEGDVLDDEDRSQTDGVGQGDDEPVDPACLLYTSPSPRD